MKSILNNILKKTILNWKHPWYSKGLFTFCMRYIDLCYGDNNFNRETNGEYRIIKIIAPTIKTVFDIGANEGDYASEIIRVNSDVKIHCFEPDPRAFAKLKENKSLVVNNIALGEKNEKKLMNLANKSTHNSLLDIDENFTGKTEVDISTVSNYCLKNRVDFIDFMKIDVEGWEYFVLLGAKELLQKGAINYVQFEFSGASCEARTFLKDFINLFDGFDYDLYRIKATSIEKVIYNPGKERFTLTNYFAIRRGIEIIPELNAKQKDF